MTQDELVREMAKIVIKGNLECYKQCCADEDELECAENFKKFGVTDETVLEYMKDLLFKVLEEVEEQQSFIADCLYDT